jgi:hypothetical protein
VDLSTWFWIGLLGLLDAVGVFYILKYGVRHGEPTPKKPEDSPAVRALRQMNAERAARIEAARARAALPAGEAKSS